MYYIQTCVHNAQGNRDYKSPFSSILSRIGYTFYIGIPLLFITNLHAKFNQHYTAENLIPGDFNPIALHLKHKLTASATQSKQRT